MKDFSELLSITFLLASERGATVQEIAERFGYSSRSSIYSDFGNIYKHFGMVVEATEERRGPTGREVVQRISKDDWAQFRSSLIGKMLTDDDRLMLSFMMESIGSLSPLVSVSKDTLIPRLRNLVGDMMIKPSGSKGYFALSDAKNLLALLKAQTDKSYLYIDYNSERTKLWPLKCFVFSGGIYCYVLRDDGVVYNISVPRIERITIPLAKSSEKRPDTDFDIDKALADPFGIIREKKEFTAVVRIDKWQGLYELEKSWPDSVKIEDAGDYYIFTVRTSGKYWLKRWVLSLGEKAELLEPEFIRDEIRTEIEEMLSFYQRDKNSL